MPKNFARRSRARITGVGEVRQFAMILAGVAMLVAAGCGESIEAGSLEPGDDSTSSETATDQPPEDPTTETEPTKDPTAGPEPTVEEPDAEPSEEEILLNVCELVPAQRVRAIFGRDKTPTMDDPEQVAPGVPGVGTVYRCTYRFEPGETTQFITIAAMTETGEPDPTTYVANVLGDGYAPVGGYGDAAGAIRSARFGNGIGAFAQARSTDTDVAGVFVQGPEESTDDQFGRLSDEFFTALKTFEEEAES